MVQWSSIGDAFGVFIVESKASEDAKRRGLVPGKRRGDWVDPNDHTQTVVARSVDGGARLVAVKGAEKTTKKRAAKKVTKSITIQRDGKTYKGTADDIRALFFG